MPMFIKIPIIVDTEIMLEKIAMYALINPRNVPSASIKARV